MRLALTSAAILLFQTGVRAGDDLLYDEIAQRWSKRNGVEDAKTVAELLERAFAHLAVGAFDVYLPAAALQDAKAVDDARAALLAVIDAQRGLASWKRGTPVDELAGAKRKDDPLAKWLATLTPKSFASRAAAGADLAALAEAPEPVRAALETFRKEQRVGATLTADRERAGVPLAIFPRRSEFVEFTCVAGALDATLKSSAWAAGVTTWLEYQADKTTFLTLEYAASASGADFEKGVSVGARNPAALGELVTQAACRALFAHVLSDGLDPALRASMANALVIDLYGELDTRIDGDVRARSSEGRSVFVPGGNPNGGTLPATSAENRWRETKGKDHFVGILSHVQKQSGKKGKTRPEKLAFFELASDDGSKRELVSAPFLGPSAVPPGEEVFGDYLELVRCYGVAFLHWLRVEGTGKEAESAARFGDFLHALARGANTEDVPRVLQEIYGQPLSADSVLGLFDGPTLEGRFLAWLSRQD